MHRDDEQLSAQGLEPDRLARRDQLLLRLEVQRRRRLTGRSGRPGQRVTRSTR
jgi:hypothetical protein